MNYEHSSLSLQQKIGIVLVAGLIGFILGYLFYQHLLPSLLFSGIGIYAPRIWIRMKIKSRKEALKRQFKQALHILSSALAAGKSVENAFITSLDDLRMLYPAPRTDIVMEWQRILERIQNREPIETALADFSSRAQLEDIKQFTDVFMISKRSGGNMVEIIRQTAQIIGEKMEMQLEIEVMLSRKKFESRIIFVFPILLIALLSWGSPEYMAPLFEGVGRLIMTAALIVILLSWWMHLRIMRIEF